jgi:branched-chain amino acid transport system permease protein
MDERAIIQYALSGLTLGSIYAVVALSLTLVYNATGVVNFAQGNLVTVGGLVSASLAARLVPMPFIAVVAVLSATAIAAIIYRLTVAPIPRASTFTSILVTLGVAIVLTNLSQIVWGTQAKGLSPITPGAPIDIFGARITVQAVWVIAAVFASMVVLFAFFTRTSAGQRMLAVAEDREGAALIGINVPLVKLVAYLLAGAFAGAAGFLVTPLTSALYSTGLTYTLKGFSAAVLGGFGSATGAVVGGLTLGLLEAFGGAFLTTGYQDLVALVILVLVLMFRPGGILGTRVLE